MAYTDGTLADKLLAVRTAVQAILSGAQSYSLGGRTLTKGSLAELLKEEKYLEAKIRRAGGSTTTLADLSGGGSATRRDQL